MENCAVKKCFCDLICASNHFNIEFSRKWTHGRILDCRAHLLYTGDFATNWPVVKRFLFDLQCHDLLCAGWENIVAQIEPLNFKNVLLFATGFDMTSDKKVRVKVTLQFAQHPQWFYEFRNDFAYQDFSLYERQSPMITFEDCGTGLVVSKIHYWFSSAHFHKNIVHQALDDFGGKALIQRLARATQWILTWGRKHNTVYIWTKNPCDVFNTDELVLFDHLELFDLGGFSSVSYCFLVDDLNTGQLSEVNFYYVLK